jgi:glycosyltransferase involved in cell wall biosynthesis
MKQNKKIALLYNFAQHYRKSIFKKLDDNLDIDFYFGNHLDWAPDLKKMDLGELKGFRKELQNIRFLKLFIWQKGSLKAIINKGYTHVILYGDSFYLSNWLILIYCRLFKIKTAIWTHGLYHDIKGLSGLYNRAFYSLANYILLYGNYAKGKMIENGFIPSKLLVIYNSLDYEKQLEIRKELNESTVYLDNFGNSKPVLLYIGRIQKVKKIEMIIIALLKLKFTEYEFNLVIIGDDNEGGVNLQHMVSENQLQENVWFYGACYDEEVIGDLLYNATACVSPGNIGLTAMHSLVYGTPAITHNNFTNQGPEFEAIEAGKTGDFFEENNIDSLIEKIKVWIEKSKFEREIIRVNCYKKIDFSYNPNFQFNVINSI